MADNIANPFEKVREKQLYINIGYGIRVLIPNNRNKQQTINLSNRVFSLGQCMETVEHKNWFKKYLDNVYDIQYFLIGLKCVQEYGIEKVHIYSQTLLPDLTESQRTKYQKVFNLTDNLKRPFIYKLKSSSTFSASSKRIQLTDFPKFIEYRQPSERILWLMDYLGELDAIITKLEAIVLCEL